MNSDGCYQMTFVDPQARDFWSATIYNGDGYLFNDFANISSETNPENNPDRTYTLRLGCDGQPNNISIREGNKTGKFNVVMRHYGPSEMVKNKKEGCNPTENIEKVIRASNQLGLAVRGLFGEGSEASGHIYQISNQQTLGESEGDILARLGGVLKNILEHELNARYKYIEDHKAQLFDKIGRSYGVLRNAHIMNSDEAMKHLSFMRLAVDLGLFEEEFRGLIDYLFMEIQPGHIQYPESELSVEFRDIKRAELLRNNFQKLPLVNFDNFSEQF